MSKLETGVEIKYPWLGISGLPLNNRIAKELSLDIEEGIYVMRVVDGGPADQAGLRGDSAPGSATEPAKDGDIIVEVDGDAIASIKRDRQLYRSTRSRRRSHVDDCSRRRRDDLDCRARRMAGATYELS